MSRVRRLLRPGVPSGSAWPLALATLPVVLLWPLFLADRVFWWGTPLLQFAPWRSLAARSWQAGEVPLWDPYLGGGAPLAANLQSSVFYPPNWLLMLFPIERAMGYDVVLHLVLAGLFAYALGRTWGWARFAAAIAGAAYLLSGYLVGRAEFLSISQATAWLPLLILAAERGARALVTEGPTRPAWARAGGWALLLATAWALELLAGHAQTAYFCAIATLAYIVWRGWRHPALLVLPLAALALGSLIAGVQLLSAAELTAQSPRASGLDDYDRATGFSLGPWQVLTLLAPNLFGNPGTGEYWGPSNFWEFAAYIGVLPLLLALVGVFVGGMAAPHPGASSGSPSPAGGRGGDSAVASRKPFGLRLPLPLRGGGRGVGAVPSLPDPRWYLLALGLVALILAMGKYLPGYRWLFVHIPTVGTFQGPARWLLLTVFALAMLAGRGAQLLLAEGRARSLPRRLWSTLGAIGGGCALATALVSFALPPNLGARISFLPALFGLGLLLLASVLLVGRFRPTMPLPGPGAMRGGAAGMESPAPLARGAGPGVRAPLPALWPILALALVALDLLWAGMPLNPLTPSESYAPVELPTVTAARAALAEGQGRLVQTNADSEAKFARFHSFKRFGASDPATVRALRDSLQPNLPALEGLRDLYSYDPLQVREIRRLTDAIHDDGYPAQLLDVVAGRVVAPAQPLAPRPDLVPIGPGAWPLYLRPDAPGRARIVPAARVAQGHEDALAQLRAPGHTPRRQVVLEPGAPQISGGAGRASIVEDRAQRVTIQADAPQGGYLVLADTDYPGWQATVDGQPAPIWRADYAFRAVVLPPGQHTVEFRYEPNSFRLGLALTAVGGVVWVALGVLAWRGMSGGTRAES